jgi:minimal PKS acyl carrier protein
VEELSELMKKAAGVTVAPEELEQRNDSGFDGLGIDSLGLLGIVGELENRYGTPMPPDAERCKTPRQFLDLVNGALMAGA